VGLRPNEELLDANFAATLITNCRCSLPMPHPVWPRQRGIQLICNAVVRSRASTLVSTPTRTILITFCCLACRLVQHLPPSHHQAFGHCLDTVAAALRPTCKKSQGPEGGRARRRTVDWVPSHRLGLCRGRPAAPPHQTRHVGQRRITRGTLPCCAARDALFGWICIQERWGPQLGFRRAQSSRRRTPYTACLLPSPHPAGRSRAPAATGRWASAARGISLATAALGLVIFVVSIFYLSHMTETTGKVGAAGRAGAPRMWKLCAHVHVHRHAACS
jgi:hypothetical protein